MIRPERAQSEVIGVVLLLGLTTLVVGSTVALGSVALDDSQETADLNRVEGAMTQLDSKASLVAHGESPSQRVRIDRSRAADLRVDETAGWMRIDVETDDGSTSENVTLGTVAYERGDDTVAYQGGGVWRANGDHARMISPPEFHYRGSAGTGTLTLPLVTVRETDDRPQDVVVVSAGQNRTERLFPSENGSNPLVGGNVTITVGSEYAEAWGRFFESRTRANVTSVGENTVEITLRTRVEHPTLNASVSATGQPRLELGDIDTMYVDSYDSRDGTYSTSGPRDGATIQTKKELHLTAGGGGNTETITIRGDLLSESNQLPKGQADKKLNVTGDIRTGVSFDEVIPASGEISERIQAVRDSDIEASGTVQPGDWSVSGTETVADDTYVDGDLTVTNGTLRVSDGATLHVSGAITVGEDGEIDLETGGGDVTVLAEGEFGLAENAAVRAEGGADANLYVDDDLAVQNQTTVTTAADTRLLVYTIGEIDIDGEPRIAAADDLAKNLWIYSAPGSGGGDDAGDIEIETDAGDGLEFTGVFYAPESEAHLDGEMTIKGSFTFYTLTFDDAVIDFHYDEALRTEQPFDGDSVPVVSYLHVSEHRVGVGGDG
ncbi:MAG: hypothetical protein A07HR67_01747 [uncultured archaeon A07HR67]|nr:MAG: hypothetical protein A07HR67_01747 [uncultured archaeon A07HR67]